MRQLIKTRIRHPLNPLLYSAVLGLASVNANAQSSNANQGSLTPARAASIATSTAITSTIVNNPFGGFGVFRYRFGTNGQNSSATGLALAPNQNSNAFSGGLAGSADFSNWSVWGTPVVSQFKNNVAPNTSNGTVVLGLMGLEYSFDDRLISGISLAADSTNSNTTYNSGTYKSSGLTVSPYIAYQISDSWLAD